LKRITTIFLLGSISTKNGFWIRHPKPVFTQMMGRNLSKDVL
jgi:hypothetical protein